MILSETIETFVEKLNKEKILTAGLDVRLIISDYFDFETHEIILNEKKIISEKEYQDLLEMVSRRLEGEPVAYILGYKYFYKSKYIVNKNVLIPRPETELLVEEALAWSKNNKVINILDMGSGSGCLGLSVLNEIPDANLTMLDISEGALDVAKRNAKNLNLEDRTDFRKIDINILSIEEYRNSFDLILANPPYIDLVSGFVETNVKKYEPELALFSSEEGFEDIHKWSERVSNWLRPSGLYLMEFGESQSEKVEKIFKENNFFIDLSIHKDYSGLPRYVKAKK